MQKILLVAGIALLAASLFLIQTTPSENPLSKFDSWKLKYQRKYTVEQQKYRYRIYASNLAMINAHNSDKAQTYFMVENQFMDLTKDEFAAIYLTAKVPEGMARREPTAISGAKVNGEVDWTGLTRVKDQGQCGSCWAFSAVGAAESYLNVRQGIKVDLSEQEINDCDKVSFGCSGGYNNYAIDYIARNGLVLQEQYPYVARDQDCQIGSGPYRVNGSQYVGGSVDNVQRAISEYPVSVLVDASNWSFYGGGVFNNCGTGINHAVLGVGFWNDGVWKIKNSWSQGWGEQGYIRLAAGNTCALLNYAYRAI